MKLEQAYLGNKGSGYSVLNNTAPRFEKEIETLCAAIGTPDYKKCPILFSHSTPEMLFMGCCQQGRPDAAKRQTLFFHIIFGNRKQCTELAVNTWSLFQNSAFEVEYDTAPEALEISEPLASPKPAPATFSWDGTPAIQSEHAENELICSLLGDSINSVSWFGYSAKKMDKAALYAASADTIRLAGVASYTPTGEKIPPRIVAAESKAKPIEIAVSQGVPAKRCILPWVIVVILIAVIVMLFCKLGQNGTTSVNPKPTIQTEAIQYQNKMAAISKELEKFNIDAEMKKIEQWDSQKGLAGIPDERLRAFLENASKQFNNIKQIIK